MPGHMVCKAHLLKGFSHQDTPYSMRVQCCACCDVWTFHTLMQFVWRAAALDRLPVRQLQPGSAMESQACGSPARLIALPLLCSAPRARLRDLPLRLRGPASQDSLSTSFAGPHSGTRSPPLRTLFSLAASTGTRTLQAPLVLWSCCRTRGVDSKCA